MFKGIFPVLPTMFGKENTLDLQAQKRVIRFALSAQVNGLVFPGVASEFQFLSTAERETLIQQLVSEVGSQFPIIGGASAGTEDDAIALGSAMASRGIRTLMIMAPNNLGPQAEPQLRFFQRIAAALPDCEIMLQNAPSPIGAGLSADTLLQIIEAVPTIRYVKEESLPSGPTISTLHSQAPAHLNGIFGGGGARFIIDELNRGSLGAMPAVEMSDLHVALYKAATNNQEKRARALYRLSLPLLVAQSTYRMRLTKYVLHRRGIANTEIVRANLPELDSVARSDIDTMLEDLRKSAIKEQAFDWIDAPQ